VSQPRLSLVSAVSLSWLSLVSLGSVLSHPCFTLVSSWLCLGSVASQPWLCLGSALSQPCLCLGSVLSQPCSCLGSVLAQPGFCLGSVSYLPFLSLVSVLSLASLSASALATTSLACAPTPASLHSPPESCCANNTFSTQILAIRCWTLLFVMLLFLQLSLHLSTCMICVPLGPGVIAPTLIHFTQLSYQWHRSPTGTNWIRGSVPATTLATRK
jgi:hypothetical protein